MNHLAQLKAQTYRERSKLLRLTLFKRNRKPFPDFIPQKPGPQGFAPHPPKPLSKIHPEKPQPEAASGTGQAQSLRLSEKVSFSKGKLPHPSQSRVNILRGDIRILLNEMYQAEPNEFLLILAIKLANVLIKVKKEGLLELLRADAEFLALLESQLFSEGFVLFLSQPFGKQIVARNQLSCLDTFFRLFDYSPFFNSNEYLLRRLVANLFVHFNCQDHLLLKLQALGGLRCPCLKASLPQVVQVTLGHMKLGFPTLAVSSKVPDFQLYRENSNIIFELVSLWEAFFSPATGLCESNQILETELESVLLATAALTEDAIRFLTGVLEAHSEVFQFFNSQCKSPPQPLVYLFSFIFKILDLSPAAGARVDLSKCLLLYLDLLEKLDEQFLSLPDGFKEFVLVVNCLVVALKNKAEGVFSFELFYLKHGLRFFSVFRE